jgi:hypothetical protein
MPTATGYVYGAIGVYDSVANVETAYKNGQLATLENITLLSTTNSAYKNGNLSVRVLDTVANIESLLDDPNYSTLVSKVYSVVVLDTAANIASDINNKGDWNSAVGIANNIVVQDSYANVQSNANTLFGGNWSGEVTKVIFTDITGASTSSPLMVSSNYSNNGQLPIFDFSQALGFSGAITVSEVASAAPAGSNANRCIALTISDTSGHQVVIDLLSYSYNSFTDSNNSDLYSVILPQANLPGVSHRIVGGVGNETLVGVHSANAMNSFVGGGGNDDITADSRADAAEYSGNLSNYTISFNNDTITIADKRTTAGNDGTDTLHGINLLKFADGFEFIGPVAQRTALTGTESNNTIQVSESKLYNGTNVAEKFVVSPYVSAMILAGEGDSVVLQGKFSDFAFTTRGTELQIAKYGTDQSYFVTTVNLAGNVTIRTDQGGVNARMDMTQSTPTVVLDTQIIYANTTLDYTQLTGHAVL